MVQSFPSLRVPLHRPNTGDAPSLHSWCGSLHAAVGRPAGPAFVSSRSSPSTTAQTVPGSSLCQSRCACPKRNTVKT